MNAGNIIDEELEMLDVERELLILRKCVNAELTGEMWQNLDLLEIITYRGFLCSVDKKE